MISGGLLILSVLIPNLATFARRGRDLMRRRRGPGAVGLPHRLSKGTVGW